MSRQLRTTRHHAHRRSPASFTDHNDKIERGERWKRFGAGIFLALLFVALTTALVVGLRASEANERSTETLCLTNRTTAVSVLVLLDTTDPLARDSGPRFRALVNRIRSRLPRNGRLTVASFDGNVARPLNQVFDWCSPGQGIEADQTFEGRLSIERQYQQRFQVPLERAAASLANVAPSAQSPIAEQIERAVNDPALGWSGDEREIYVLTDGLQNMPGTSVYEENRVVLPAVDPQLLKDVTVHYVELGNLRRPELQNSQGRATWQQWFEDAGATRVLMYAPGYPAPRDGLGS